MFFRIDDLILCNDKFDQNLHPGSVHFCMTVSMNSGNSMGSKQHRIIVMVSQIFPLQIKRCKTEKIIISFLQFKKKYEKKMDFFIGDSEFIDGIRGVLVSLRPNVFFFFFHSDVKGMDTCDMIVIGVLWTHTRSHTYTWVLGQRASR